MNDIILEDLNKKQNQDMEIVKDNDNIFVHTDISIKKGLFSNSIESEESSQMSMESIEENENEDSHEQQSSEERTSATREEELREILEAPAMKLDIDEFGTDEQRNPWEGPQGGHLNSDRENISRMRGVVSHMVGMLGRQLLTGKMDLTKICIPVNICIADTNLSGMVLNQHWPYLAWAAIEEGVERLKLAFIGTIAANNLCSIFGKPLNPILGETMQVYDKRTGTRIDLEQTSHHPPTSAMYAENIK